MSELLPCPLCGSAKVSLLPAPADSPGEYAVVCHGCHVGTVHSPSISTVMKCWNTRAQPIAPENPYPADVFPMTMEQYAQAVPDEQLRTAISGCVGRHVWDVCCEEWRKRPGVGEAGRTDAERLDWLEKHANKYNTWVNQECGRCFDFGTAVTVGDAAVPLRAAIDAAMNESEAK